jgi:hypothetical protein
MLRLGPCYCAVLILLLAALPMHAQCSKSTVNGRYGFVSSLKTIVKPGNAVIKVRFIGLLNYDGAGGATGTGLLVGPSGDPQPISVKGTYEVAAACNGRVTLADQNNSQSSWQFVIVNGASELLTISEKSSDTSPFSQKKQ